jgi:hypothetical protein
VNVEQPNSKQRSAADILLALEAKVEQLMQMHRNLDLNMKILSNKFNQFINASLNVPNPVAPPPSAALPLNNLYPPAVEQPQEEFTEYNNSLSVETTPVGFRRTSRPETFDDGSTKNNKSTPSVSLPNMHSAQETQSSTIHQSLNERKPVIQRVVDKNGKAIFMAEVEITNLQTNIVEVKTRTNGVGKWQASLSTGRYRVALKKQQSVGKEKVEILQELDINESTPTELQVLIIK